MKKPALGILEFNSIAQGISASDAALKKANIELVLSRTICPGKYIVIINAEVDEVKASVRESEENGGYHNVDSVIIPNLDSRVPPAISGTTDIKMRGALGIVETFAAPTAIYSADAAVKAADVNLLEIRIANGIGGKTFYTLTGGESSVRAAVETGVEVIRDSGLLMNHVIIPAPDNELYKHLL